MQKELMEKALAFCGHIAPLLHMDAHVLDLDAPGHFCGACPRNSFCKDCTYAQKAGRLGFRILQFNAVVADNIHARHLYARIGFHQLGTIPGGFRKENGQYADICPYYIEVQRQAAPLKSY